MVLSNTYYIIYCCSIYILTSLKWLNRVSCKSLEQSSAIKTNVLCKRCIYLCATDPVESVTMVTLQVLMPNSDVLPISDFFDRPFTRFFNCDPYLIHVFTLDIAYYLKHRSSLKG